jgi:hypothetical protein
MTTQVGFDPPTVTSTPVSGMLTKLVELVVRPSEAQRSCGKSYTVATWDAHFLRDLEEWREEANAAFARRGNPFLS